MAIEKISFLNGNTLVPVGLFAALAVTAVTAVVWLNGQLLKLNYGQDRINEKLSELASRVESGTTDRWTRTDMMHWIILANAKNSAISLPPIEAIR